MRFDTSGNNCRFLDQEQARKTIWCRGNSDDGCSPVLRYVSGKLLATELPDRRYRITNTFVSFYKYTTVMSYLIPTNRKESWLLFWNPRIVIPQPFSSLRRFVGMAANPLNFFGSKGYYSMDMAASSECTCTTCAFLSIARIQRARQQTCRINCRPGLVQTRVQLDMHS